MQGISWGYSVFLMHQELDADTRTAVLLLFNSLQRLKQHFREARKDLKESDVLAVYHSEYYFLSKLHLSNLRRLD